MRALLFFLSQIFVFVNIPLYPSWLTSSRGAIAVPKRPKVYVPVRMTGLEKVSGASWRYRYTLPTSLGLLSVSLSMKSGAPTSTSSVLRRHNTNKQRQKQHTSKSESPHTHLHLGQWQLPSTQSRRPSGGPKMKQTFWILTLILNN